MNPAPLTPVQEEALLLRSRIESGEEVPLEDLQTFILRANSNLKTQRKADDRKEGEIDFF
jgi:hypothetical protein